jgi:hypothetical protein
MVPISSPLTPPLGDGEETDKKGAVVKRLKVQAIKKDIKQVNKHCRTLFASMKQLLICYFTDSISMNVQNIIN